MEEIIDFLKSKMTVEEVGGGLTTRHVLGVLNPPVTNTIKEIKEYFSATDYTPIFDTKKKKHIVRYGIFKKAEDKPKYWLNILLFVATLLSTSFAGYLNYGDIYLGVLFSLSIMTILTCHELGHYFVSRKAGMITTLPYFIPVPFHFIGTFGAVIRMKSIVPNRSSLLRVGMAGPIAGFLVALPITVIGIALSEVQVAVEGATYIQLGDSLLFATLGRILHPNIAEGADVFLHPMAFAGWLGFFVTFLNLIPVGQLDGGHITYSVLLKMRRYLHMLVFSILAALALSTIVVYIETYSYPEFIWPGWFFVGVLFLLVARRDPVIQDSITPLTTGEKFMVVWPLLILILTFIPQPFAIW
jgi:membrane-associated protease RseP (regulator of RpoE activity)